MTPSTSIEKQGVKTVAVPNRHNPKNSQPYGFVILLVEDQIRELPSNPPGTEKRTSSRIRDMAFGDLN
jgi:hypothetical protein